VSATPVELACERLCEALRRRLAGQEIVRLAIPGGSALAVVAESRAALAAEWSRVALTWVDERCVPLDHPASNRGAAARLGVLDRDPHAAQRPAPRRVLPLFEDGETPEAAVARAADRLSIDFGGALDVLLLGMGEDGHVASLFPSMPPPSGGLVAHVADSPKPPPHRITLTRTALETATRTVLLASGESKRGALERLLAGDSHLPAHGLTEMTIVTDLEIAPNAVSNGRGGGCS